MVGQLGETRLLHSLLVADEAVIMGRRFGGDLTRLALAGLLHDGAKEMPTPALLALAEAQGLITDPAERARPSILHGPVAAWLAERHWGISDPVILEAIRFHTTGGPGMSREACIIFMADLIEPSRDYPGVELLRRLCRQDLRAAMIEAINQTFDYLARKKQPVHAGMTRCLEWLRQEKGGLPRMESKEMAIIAARAMAAKKGAKITVLKLEDLTLITDFFVVATGSSRTQTQAMAGGAEDELKKHGIRPHRIEGFREGRWILLDFGQVIIHIFQTDERDFYNLERLWADAPALPAEEVLPE
jgi:ribosome silencing factor RsfS/YbeB/iojap